MYTTIYTTDGSAYQISNWEQVKDSDGKVTATYLHLKDVEGRVTFNKGTLTFADNSTKKWITIVFLESNMFL